MAVTETVKIVFEIDDKPIANTVQQLVALGKVSQEDAAKFNELSSASKVVSSSLGEASQGAQKFADAGKEINNSSKDIAKSASGIGAAGKPIRDAGNNANEAGKKFSSLKSQLAAAKNEAQLAEKRFGEFSRQAIDARNKAGQLADQIGDLNRQVGLLNPESKVQAFTNLGQGIVGAFQIATGALQAFGIENEQVQQIAQRLQGALNLGQGIQSIIQLKESFKDVQVVLNATGSAAQTISTGTAAFDAVAEAASNAAESGLDYTTALESTIGAAGNSATVLSTYKKTQDATSKATDVATTSTKGLNAALKANPAFLVATGIGVLVGAIVLLSSKEEDYKKQREATRDLEKDVNDEKQKQLDAEFDLAVASGEKTNLEKQYRDIIKATSEEYGKQAVQLVQNNQKIEENNNIIEANQKRIAQLRERNKEGDILQIQSLESINEKLGKENTIYTEQNKLVQQILDGILNRGKLALQGAKEREEQLRKEKSLEFEIADTKKIQLKIFQDSLSSIEDEKKRRADSLALLREQGVEQDDILQKQIQNNEWEVKALQTVRAKNGDIKLTAESQAAFNRLLEDATKKQDFSRVASLKNLQESLSNAKSREDIQRRINQLLRDNVLISAQISNIETKDLIEGVEKNIKAKQDQLDLDKARGTIQSKLIQDEILGNAEAIKSYQAVIEADKQTINNKETQEEIQKRINELVKKNELLTIGLNKTVQDETDDAFNAEIAYQDRLLQNKILNNEKSFESNKDLNEENRRIERADLDANISAIEEKIAIYNKYGKNTTEIELELAKLKKEKAGEEIADAQKVSDEKIAAQERFFEIANSATDLIIEANQRQYEEEIAALEESKEKGLITEEQYEARLKKLKQKAAEDNKKAQVFQATMSAAQAILSALTIVADPATKIAAVAFAATVGALNLAKVIATPIPKFKKGTLAVPGRDTGEDTVHAMLRPGEAVIPTEINREYAPIIRAIYRKEISSKEMNEFIESRNRSERQDTSKHLSTKDISEFINSRKNISYEEFSEVMRSKNSHLVTTKTIDVEPILKFDQVSLDALFKRDIKVSRINSTVNNTSAAAMPSINVKADVDTYALSRAMAKNKSMELSNPDIVAKALAQELSKLDNPRRR